MPDVEKFFPSNHFVRVTLVQEPMMGWGWGAPGTTEAAAYPCQRCHLLTLNQEGHIAWHRSVDSGATTKLAGVDNAPPSE